MTKKRLGSIFPYNALVLLFAVKIIIMMALYNRPFSGNEEFSANFFNARELKTILIWNSAHRIETSAFGEGHEAFLKAECPVDNCIVYTNRSTLPLEEYDAIIIHVKELWMTEMPKLQRRQDQRFIFLSQESPSYLSSKPSNFDGVFNWTMTYKRNSDVQLLYGRVAPKQSAPKTDAELCKLKDEMHDLTRKNFATGKSNLVVWMASHCTTDSLREEYVRELNKSVKVDVYGGCGDLTCPRDNKNWLSYPHCYDILEKKYKFYLSFENSICNDYVTEKFFNILNYTMVPIVYGGANYSAIAPPYSYINALDFTPQALADYLKLLDRNDTLYNEYFWWKGHYELESGVHQMSRHAFCDLCQKLNEDKQTKIYEDLVPEWDRSNQCKEGLNWGTKSSS